jgi:hypothetical protein
LNQPRRKRRLLDTSQRRQRQHSLIVDSGTSAHHRSKRIPREVGRIKMVHLGGNLRATSGGVSRWAEENLQAAGGCGKMPPHNYWHQCVLAPQVLLAASHDGKLLPGGLTSSYTETGFDAFGTEGERSVSVGSLR